MVQAGESGIVIIFPSVSGKLYRLERSDSLVGGSWTTVEDDIAGTGAEIQVADTPVSLPLKRFYRIVVAP